MVTVDIAVKTIDRSPRDKKNYLGITLRNLKRAGVFKSKNLGRFWIVDGGSLNPEAYYQQEGVTETGHQVFTDHAVRTMHQNAQRCIDLASSGGADYALVLEDDINTCSNFLESVVKWLDQHELSTPNMYVFGCNYQQLELMIRRGSRVWPYPCESFYGALACCWPREVAQGLAKWLGPDPFYKNEKGEEVKTHGHDLLLGRWGEWMGFDHFLASAPNFVQHIGVDSGLNNKKVIYPAWNGPEWSYV